MRSIVEALKKRIINMSNKRLYGIDISGKIFSIPESLLVLKDNPVTNFIRFEVSHENDQLHTELYPLPENDRPTVIKQMGIMIFLTEQDMNKEIKKFGSPVNLVQTYLLEENNLFFGAGKTIINMSKNDYWITEGNRIFKIPTCDETWKNEYFHTNNLNEQDIGDKDLMVIFTYVGGNTAEGRLKVTNYNNRWVKRFARNINEPIILEDSNMFIFSSKESAEYFVSEYNGSMSRYYEHVASKIVTEKHTEELKEISGEYKKDKLAIAKTCGLIAGSTLLFEGVRIGINYIRERIAEKSAEKIAMSMVNMAAESSTLAVPIIGGALVLISGTLLIAHITEPYVNNQSFGGAISRVFQYAKDIIHSVGTKIKDTIGGFFRSIGNVVGGLFSFG